MLSHAEIIRLLENDPANFGPGEPFSDVVHGPYGDCVDCPCDKSEPADPYAEPGAEPGPFWA